MQFESKRVSKKKQIELYKALLFPRMIEEKMLILLRQGRISKWFGGIGQEAISVGATMALEDDEIIFPMHRNLGVFTTRKIPFERLFSQWQGTSSGFTKGRDRSFHFGTMDYNVVGMISHLGAQLALADGVALANKIGKEQKVTIAFTGEGGTSEGDFHEALNVASVWQLPVIFIIENNGYGLSTPTSEQYNCKDLADRALGYGMKSHIIDGNNVLEVYNTISKIAKSLRKNPEPVLVECKTFRMRGHEEASGTKYVPKELMEYWAEKDPITNYEKHLIEADILSESDIKTIRTNYKKEINETLKKAYEDEPVTVDLATESQDIYAPFEYKETLPATTSTTEKRFIDAISDGLRQAMEKYDNLVLMGQDIAEYGGVFKITQGFLEQFGHDRVRNTPICESVIVGAGLGLSLKGYKAMVEMQFSDFVTCGFNQIVNNLAKVHYRWGQNADVVIRMPAGAGVAAGPFHSQTNEAWFTHTPGLKVVFPSNPQDAKGLLLAAFEDPNPVLFFEHKALYRKISAEVSDDYFTVEIGKAAIAKAGSKATIITYGMGVHWALETVDEMNIDVEIIDLRTLQPIDYETIATSIKKTNRVILLHEDVEFGGIGGEISAYISEYLFEYLDAPVMRCASINTPVPFNAKLEKQFLATRTLKEKLEKLLAF
ncbi:MAG: thiamine pyrophosphate-dependent enzyme [Saprospiraceae bacterium]